MRLILIILALMIVSCSFKFQGEFRTAGAPAERKASIIEETDSSNRSSVVEQKGGD
jgi:ABC-type cobalt transport system substrate-binding protein